MTIQVNIYTSFYSPFFQSISCLVRQIQEQWSDKSQYWRDTAPFQLQQNQLWRRYLMLEWNGTARTASPMVRILKKRRLSLLSNTTCNELQMQCSSCTCVIKHRKLMLAWLCLSKVGMIMFVEFRPIYFSISPTQTFLGLHHTLTVLPHDCWGGLHYERKKKSAWEAY